MTQTTGHPRFAPVRIGPDGDVHLGLLISRSSPNGEPRYCPYCPAGVDGLVIEGEAVAEEITCTSCRSRASATVLEQVSARWAERPNKECDHNGLCIGCGSERHKPCTSGCGFETGRVDAAMVLRAGARRLDDFPRGQGVDIRAALGSGAAALLPTEPLPKEGEIQDAQDLVDAALGALGAHLDEAVGHEAWLNCLELVDEYAVLVPRRMLMEALYLAATRTEGASFDQVASERLLGRAVRELQVYCPDAETLLVNLTGDTNTPEIELCGVKDTDEQVYAALDWINVGAEGAYLKAAQLVVRALKASPPPYLRKAAGWSASHEFDVADTTYGRTLRR